jgi:hypothetical protein
MEKYAKRRKKYFYPIDRLDNTICPFKSFVTFVSLPYLHITVYMN